MGHEKLTEVSVPYFFILLHCCYGDIRDEICRYKKIQRRATKIVIKWYHRFKFQVEVEVNCIFHFIILRIKLFRHNKFFLQYRYVDKLKITMTISFAKLYLSCLELTDT